jgi:hypothetical protein
MRLADILAQGLRRLQASMPHAPLASAWPVWAGLSALVAAAALALGPTPQWRAQGEARLAELQRVTRAQAYAERALAAPTTLPPAAPEWPEATASPRRARILSTLATRQGMKVLQMREQVDTAGQLQLAQSGQATYPALRSYVERALAADAALVLDRLRLQRSDPAGSDVAFELHWTLLHRMPPARSAPVAAPVPAPAPAMAARSRP